MIGITVAFTFNVSFALWQDLGICLDSRLYPHLSDISYSLVYILLFWEVFTPALADGLSLEFEWQQGFRTLLSILAHLKISVVCMVSTRPLISKSSSLFTNPLGIIRRAPITIGITVTYMFHIFSSLTRSRYLSLFSYLFAFFHFRSVVCWDIKNSHSSFFLVNQRLVWSSGRKIRLHLKLPENSYGSNFLGQIWFLH